MKLFGFVLLLAALLLAQAQVRAEERFAAPKTPADYWRATDIKYGHLRIIIDPQNCNHSKGRFLGCVEALSKVFVSTEPAAMLVTSAELKADGKLENPVYGRVIEKFGLLTLVELKSNASENLSKAALRQKVAQQKISRAVRVAALTRLYNDPAKRNAVPFLKILKYGRPRGDSIPDKASQITGAAFNAYLTQTFDPHTYVIPKDRIYESRASAGTAFAGVGLKLDLSPENLVTVVTPIEGGPAAAAGIRSRDVIVAVDGKPVIEESFESVNSRIRGQQGTTVTLTIDRSGKRFELTLLRAPVKIDNVDFRLIADHGVPFAYIRLETFMEDAACDRVSEVVRGMEKMGARGIILDLRGNGGGLLTQATCIATLFLGPGKTIVEERSLDGKVLETHTTGETSAITELPMMTLIDSQSASASEILAGALQDNHRSWIVGQRSYGKGTVQQPEPFSSKTLLFQTVERFFLPSGRSNQKVGIQPNFLLPQSADVMEEREEDMPNALPAAGPAWTEDRPEAVADIRSCVANIGKSSQLIEARANEQFRPDAELLATQDLLLCAAMNSQGTMVSPVAAPVISDR